MQQDDEQKSSGGSVVTPAKVDYAVLKAGVDQLDKACGKIKGIIASRIEQDLNSENLEEIAASANIVISRDASVELLKFVRYKLNVGQYSKNYQQVYKSIFGAALYEKIMAGKLTNDERFTAMQLCVSRLFCKRPLVFYGVDDTAMLRDGNSTPDSSYFIKIASNVSQLLEYISYSELEFSRRIAISSLTNLYKFTGHGYEKLSNHCVFVHGHSGIRLERKETPEYKKLIVTESNQPELFKTIKPVGLMGAVLKMTVGAACKSDKSTADYISIQAKPRAFLDISLYQLLICEIFENYLSDCNRMAEALRKKAYVRLNPPDLRDTSYSIAGITTPEQTIIDLIANIQYGVLKAIIDHADFAKKYPAISTIELSQPQWKNQAEKIQNAIAIYKNGSNEDKSASLTDVMEGTNEKGSSADVLLCINVNCSANAYLGNRIYKSNLSSPAAEVANITNLVTLLNPIINPMLATKALDSNMLIRFPSGKLSSPSEIKEALARAEKKPPEKADRPTEAGQPEAAPATVTNKKSFKLPVKIKTMLSGLLVFFKLIFTIFKQVKHVFMGMAKSKMASIKEKSNASNTKEQDSSTSDISIDGLEEPKPAAVEEPKPAAIEEPKPAAVEEPKPAAVEEPKPAAVEEPKPAAVEEPKPAAAEEPKPAAVEEPKPAAVEEPKPAAVEEPKPAAAEEPKPAAAAEEPKPTDENPGT